jgi:hypothetical protein
MMETIREHTQGTLQFPIGQGPPGKTRLLCSAGHLSFFEAFAPPEGETDPIPIPSGKWKGRLHRSSTKRKLTKQCKDANGNPTIGMFFDPIANIFVEPGANPSLNDPNFPLDLRTCGKTNIALTSTLANVIIICPLAWGGTFQTDQGNSYEFGPGLPATTAEIQITQDTTFLDNLRSLATTLLHEYCHLVGRGKRHNLSFLNKKANTDYRDPEAW